MFPFKAVTIELGPHGLEHVVTNAFPFDPDDMLGGHSAGLRKESNLARILCGIS